MGGFEGPLHDVGQVGLHGVGPFRERYGSAAGAVGRRCGGAA